MSEIEALLSVDAGKVPADTVAFFVDDVDRRGARALAILAGLMAVAAAACAISGCGLVHVTLLLLIAAVVGVFATPTLPEEADKPIKRPVIVVTPSTLIVRDDQGLHRWALEDVSDIEAILDNQPHLDIIDRKGNRHPIEYRGFRRGQKFRQSIANRLRV